MRRTLLIAGAAAIGLAVFCQSLQAIPAFARKYQMSCKVCHAPFPKLKPYGEEFAGNGFELKDREAPRATRDSGDDFLTLLREIPLALRIEGYITWNNGDARRLDFTSPYLVKLLSGGMISKNISYYFYFFLGERGEVAGLEDAFLMFNDLLVPGLALTVGQFQVSDPLFKRELRLTFEDYQVYRARPGISTASLTYDRGLMASYTIPGGPDLVLEVLNGAGIDPADPLRNFDQDKYKNVAARISQDLGAHARMGAFAYSGREGAGGVVNKLWMAGADATLAAGPLELNLQYMERRDDNPGRVQSFAPLPETRTRGAFAELVCLPRGDDSRWYAVALFNRVDSDQPSLDYTSWTAHAGLMLRRNLRLGAEASWMRQGESGGRHLRLLAGIVGAF